MDRLRGLQGDEWGFVRRTFCRDMQTLFEAGAGTGLTDRQVLDQFTSQRDATAQAAFQVLVIRHGPMVLRVCQNLLQDPNDVQDAFQATFLVLVKQGSSIRRLNSVGGWLYGVACRVAARARVDAGRRRRAEQSAALRVVEAVSTEADDQEREAFGPIVQEEVRRLPEKFRAVVVLCYWEGLTQDQAAVQLGCPLGTVRSRLARARNLLRRRLTRRGLASLAGVMAAGLDQAPATASVVVRRLAQVPPELVHSTIRAAVRFAAGESTAEAVSVVAASLVRRALWSMAMIKVKMSVVGVVLVGLMGSGAWYAALDVPHARAQLKTIQKPAPRNKNVEAAVSEKGFCSVPGQNVVIAFVENGSLVKKGDLVCELDSEALRDQLVNQQITFLSAKANYETAKLDREIAEIAVVEYEEGIFKEQDLEAEGNVKIAEAELTFALDRLAAAKANREGVPLEIKRTSWPGFATGSPSKTQSRKKALLDFTRGKRIKELKSAVEKSRAAELATKAIWELELGKEKKLERAISACRILAPRDGTVVQAVAEGSTVHERQIMFEIRPSPEPNAGIR